MKMTMHGARIKDSRGFSLLELVVVIGIMMTLMGIAGFFYKEWMDRYNAEGQVKTMHADIMQARLRAMERNRQHFVVLAGSSYQIVEDTNENGTVDAAPNDTVQLSKTLNYPPTADVTIIMDTRGIISTSTDTFLNSASVGFNTGAASPEYNCFLLRATRISIGKMNGADCVAK